jgi:AhpD family alkylhydroperoxidase
MHSAMKKLYIFVVACAVAASVLAKSEKMTLTTRQQALVVVAATTAKGDMEGLKAALNEGLGYGLTVSEAKEALSQLYAYTGFPRSLNALNILQQVIKSRLEAGQAVEQGREADPLPADYNALTQGTAVQTRLSGAPFNYTFAPQTDYYLKAHLFGDIFARNTLSYSDREIVTVSAISALPGCEPQLLSHVRGARNMGVSDDEIRSIPVVLREKVGEAEANRAAQMVARFFGEAEPAIIETVDFTLWPKGEPNVAYAQYFTGNSYLAPMDGGVTNVTFEPGCRNNWHIHHGSVQVLVCVSGSGWYQEWGKAPVALKPGMVIAIPDGVKHWHGAAKDSWFQHLTFNKDVQQGAFNEWLEPVSDTDYQALN